MILACHLIIHGETTTAGADIHCVCNNNVGYNQLYIGMMERKGSLWCLCIMYTVISHYSVLLYWSILQMIISKQYEEIYGSPLLLITFW